MKDIIDLIGRILLSFIFLYEAYDSIFYFKETKKVMTGESKFTIIWSDLSTLTWRYTCPGWLSLWSGCIFIGAVLGTSNLYCSFLLALSTWWTKNTSYFVHKEFSHIRWAINCLG